MRALEEEMREDNTKEERGTFALIHSIPFTETALRLIN